MKRRQSRLRKAGLLLAVAVLFVSLGSAATSLFGSGYGGSAVTQFMNSYFLPADAQVQGISGLLFGVLLPLGIVIILFQIGASRVMPDQGRAATALAILFALFMIPSGAYKTISNLIIGVFGLTSTATSINPVLPAIGPVSGVGFAGIAATAVFIGLLWMFQNQTQQDVGPSELVGTVMASALVYLVLSGGFSFTKFVTTAIILAIGWFVFRTGLEAQSNAGNLIALLGLIMMIGAVRSTQMLPRSLDSMLGAVAGGAFAIIAIIVLLLVVAIIAIILHFHPNNPFQIPGI